jgi:hypothetical protein
MKLAPLPAISKAQPVTETAERFLASARETAGEI